MVGKVFKTISIGSVSKSKYASSNNVPSTYSRRPKILVYLWGKTNQLTFQDRLLRFPDFQFSRVCLFAKYFWKHVGEISGINNKGFPARPVTKWMVLSAISTTLKCQFIWKCWKVDFSVPCKTKSRENVLHCLRTVRAVTLDTSRPPQCQPELRKNSCLWKTRFSNLSNSFFCQRWTSMFL